MKTSRKTLIAAALCLALALGLLPALRQRADFCRDYCETLAGIASARCFDTGVEGEQVCLGGNLVDHLHDIVDFLRALGEHVEFWCNFAVAVGKLIEEAILLVNAFGKLLDGFLNEVNIPRHAHDSLNDARHL